LNVKAIEKQRRATEGAAESQEKLSEKMAEAPTGTDRTAG